MQTRTHRRADDLVEGRVLALVRRQRRDARHKPPARLLTHRHQHLRHESQRMFCMLGQRLKHHSKLDLLEWMLNMCPQEQLRKFSA